VCVCIIAVVGKPRRQRCKWRSSAAGLLLLIVHTDAALWWCFECDMIDAHMDHDISSDVVVKLIITYFCSTCIWTFCFISFLSETTPIWSSKAGFSWAFAVPVTQSRMSRALYGLRALWCSMCSCFSGAMMCDCAVDWIWYWLYYRQLQIFWVYSIIRDCLISYCFPFYVLTSLICCIYSSIGWFCQIQTSGICKAGFKKSDILHLPSHQHQINNWCTLVVNYYSSLYLTTTSGDTRDARVSNYLCSFYLTPGLGMHPLIAV